MTIQDRIGRYLQSGRSWYNRNVNTIKVITVHHDAIPHDNRDADAIMSQIMATHVSKGWAGASYHYFIHRDGTIYQMNKHEWVTWHDSHNYDSIGIVMTGYFHPSVNNQPTNEQLASLKWLLDELSTKHPEFPAGKANVYGHRERSATACPGDNLAPKVTEYRTKLGNVGWGGIVDPQPPIPPPSINWEQKYNEEAKAHTETRSSFANYISESNSKIQSLQDKIDKAKSALA